MLLRITPYCTCTYMYRLFTVKQHYYIFVFLFKGKRTVCLQILSKVQDDLDKISFTKSHHVLNKWACSLSRFNYADTRYVDQNDFFGINSGS